VHPLLARQAEQIAAMGFFDSKKEGNSQDDQGVHVASF
jgi:hypothetical protein